MHEWRYSPVITTAVTIPNTTTITGTIVPSGKGLGSAVIVGGVTDAKGTGTAVCRWVRYNL